MKECDDADFVLLDPCLHRVGGRTMGEMVSEIAAGGKFSRPGDRSSL
jgi:hypothetical protein